MSSRAIGSFVVRSGSFNDPKLRPWQSLKKFFIVRPSSSFLLCSRFFCSDFLKFCFSPGKTKRWKRAIETSLEGLWQVFEHSLQFTSFRGIPSVRSCPTLQNFLIGHRAFLVFAILLYDDILCLCVCCCYFFLICLSSSGQLWFASHQISNDPVGKWPRAVRVERPARFDGFKDQRTWHAYHMMTWHAISWWHG